MEIGGIGFKHVMAFQLKCMMANQYSTLATAFNKKDDNLVLIACLRLGWNDAFRHVSENIAEINKMNALQKENLIIDVCRNCLDTFKEYAKKTSTDERTQYLKNRICNGFLSEFSKVKKLTNTAKALCFGHIQKMFNIAIKLLVCLKITAEHLDTYQICVELCKIDGKSVYFDKKVIDKATVGFSLDTADCPVDSIILNKVGVTNVIWSKIGQDNNHPTKDYLDAQAEIKKSQGNNQKSNLCYDFENWNL